MALRAPHALPTLPSLPWLLLAACLAAVACGSAEESQDVAAAPPAAKRVDVSGMYRVQGTTTVVGSDQSRELSGTLILAQEGDRYTATFNLETLYPSPDGNLDAEVIGKGEGEIHGRSLEGKARTQIVASQVPGLDAGFHMLPAAFGVRVLSEAVGSVNDDGSIEFNLINRADEGEDYVPTQTRIRGTRVDPTP